MKDDGPPHDHPGPHVWLGLGTTVEYPVPQLSPDLTKQAAERSIALAMKRRQGGIKRYEVDITMKLGPLIRAIRLERCISMRKFAKRTKLDIGFLRFMETGLASSDEIAQVFHNVVDALGVTCAAITKRLLDEEASLAKLSNKKLWAVMKSVGLNCDHIALELLGNKPINSRGDRGSKKG
ncbi:MAG TPA: hypothetical protein VJ183_10710 [Chloroflexia bacterium]|nr:hypothetical protein [Chloroflexia bacterium]